MVSRLAMQDQEDKEKGAGRMSTVAVEERTPGSRLDLKGVKAERADWSGKNKGPKKRGSSLDCRTGSVEVRIQGDDAEEDPYKQS